MNGYAHTIPKDKSVKYKSSMQKSTLDLKEGAGSNSEMHLALFVPN
jgi:hypothetical protein